MKILFALYIFIILMALYGALTSQPDELVAHQDYEPVHTTLRTIIEHEEYTVWDKKFDRYASYWLQTFEEVHRAQTLCESLNQKTFQDRP